MEFTKLGANPRRIGDRLVDPTPKLIEPPGPLRIDSKSKKKNTKKHTHLKDIVYQLRNFFIPKIIVDFRTDLHKMKINTELCCKKIRKRPKTIVIRIIVRMTIFKSVHMAFYANTS